MDYWKNIVAKFVTKMYNIVNIYETEEKKYAV